MKTQSENSSTGRPPQTGAVEQARSPHIPENQHHSDDGSLARPWAKSMENSGSREQRAPIRIVLVEPNELFRGGLEYILAEADFGSVISGGSFDEIQPSLEAENGAFLLIADAAQDFAATCERIRPLKEQSPSIRIVMLVERYDFEEMLAAIEAGAAAYLMRSTSHEVLVRILDLVLVGETIFPVTAFTQLREPGRELAALPSGDTERGFTRREIAILGCLTEGASNKVIARRLEIAESTVKVHIKAILRKLQAKNRTQAAVWAFTHIVRQKL